MRRFGDPLFIGICPVQGRPTPVGGSVSEGVWLQQRFSWRDVLSQSEHRTRDFPLSLLNSGFFLDD